MIYPAITSHHVLLSASKFYGVPVQEILNGKRTDEIVRVRGRCCLLMERLCGLRQIDIARLMNKDHSTINHATSEARKRLDANASEVEAFERLKADCVTMATNRRYGSAAAAIHGGN